MTLSAAVVEFSTALELTTRFITFTPMTRSEIDHLLAANKAVWNKRTDAHMASEFYDVQKFREGKSSLNPYELELLANVKGKSILHLQCHFGQDTLSLARMG